MDNGCYSSREIGAAMIQVGFPRDEQVIADGMATVRAESGGCRKDNGICCWGPWQLNRDNGGDSANEACAASLRCSTRVALGLWRGAGNCFGCQPGPNPWEAASTGNVADRLLARRLLAMDSEELAAIVNRAEPMNEQGGAGFFGDAIDTVGDAVGTVLDPIEKLAAIVADIARFFVGLGELLLTPEGWLRLAKILGGAILILWGLSRFANQGMGVNVGRGIRRARAVRRATA